MKAIKNFFTKLNGGDPLDTAERIRWIIVIGFLLLWMSTMAQEIRTNNVNYQGAQFSVYNEGIKAGEYRTNALFEFHDNVIKTTNKGQSKNYYFNEFTDGELVGKPVKIAQAYDEGGFDCVIHVGHHPQTGTWFIAISYDNIDFLYKCDITTKGIPKDFELPDHRMSTKVYSPDETAEVVKFLIRWGVDFTEL